MKKSEKKRKISWKEISKEYPKLKTKLIEKYSKEYPHLKDKLEIKRVETGKDGTNYYSAKSKYIFKNWFIKDKEITLTHIEAKEVPKSGPLLALSVMYYINKFCLDEIDKEKNIHFANMVLPGKAFWSKFLGFENPEKFMEFIKKEGKIEKKLGRVMYNVALPFKKFEKLVNKEWK